MSDSPFRKVAEQLTLPRYASGNTIEAIVERAIRRAVKATRWACSKGNGWRDEYIAAEMERMVKEESNG